MQKRRFKLVSWLTLISLAIISLVACTGQAPQAQIITATVKRGDIVQRVSADGSLALIQDKKLTFETSGKVTEVNVEEGAGVTKGKALAKLDTISLERAVRMAELAVKSSEVDLQQAEHNVKVAEIDLKQAELNVKASEANLSQAQLGVAAAETNLELANNNYWKLITPNPYYTYQFVVPESVDALRVAEARLKEAQDEFQKALTGQPYSPAYIQDKLANAQTILSDATTKLGWGIEAGTRPAFADYWTLRNLQLQIDNAQSALDNAKGAIVTAGIGLDNAKSMLNKAGLAVDNARSISNKAQLAVDRAKYDLDTAKDALGKAIMTAPFDGVIAKMDVKVGDVLSSINYAAVTAFEIIDPSRMELSVKVDEVDVPYVKLGQKATINVDALPDSKLDGIVTSIGSLSNVEAGVVSYEVNTSFEVPKGLVLKDGMSATADIIIAQQKNVLSVPSQAVKIDSQGKATVEIIVNGQTQTRPVVTGISDNFNTEIKEGLSEGEIVVEARVKPETGGLLGGGGF